MQITSLYIPQSDEIYNINVPALDVNFVGANTIGNVEVTAPTTNAQGAALSGNVTVSTYIDGSLSFTDEMKPGESASHTLTLAQGNHTAEAVAGLFHSRCRWRLLYRPSCCVGCRCALSVLL